MFPNMHLYAIVLLKQISEWEKVRGHDREMLKIPLLFVAKNIARTVATDPGFIKCINFI